MFEQANKKNLIRFAKIMLRYKKQHFAALFFMLVNACLMLALPYLTMKIIDNAIKGNHLDLLVKLILIYLIVVIFQSGSKLLSDFFYSVIGKKIVYDLRFKLINHLQRLSGKYYSNFKPGELTAVINNDVSAVEELATKMIFSTLSDVLISILMIIYLFQLQFDLLLISLAFQPFIIFLQKKFTQKITTKTIDLRNSFGCYSTIIQEFLSGLIHFIELNARKYFLSKYMPNAMKFMKLGIGLDFTFSLSMISVSLISAITSVVILGYGGYKVIIGAMTIGGLVAFNQYSQRLFAPIIQLSQMNIRIKQALVSVDRIFKVLDEEVEIKQINSGYHPQKILGNLKFEHVSFSYDSKTPLLEDINIDFKNGTITALVGESGSGKTTITNLLLRLWNIDKGQILLDGTDIKEYNLKFLRKNISIVSQDVFLFDDTIINNLVLSNKKISMEKIIEVTKTADIYNFIMSLPDQFNTIVGDRGIKLSGGQKQRISIARSLLKDNPIIILDEATSSLDTISETIIRDNLREFLSNKTVIIIAHRLSTIEQADMIYTINNGHIVERGTHDELIRLRNIYYSFYMRDFEKQEEYSTLQ